MPRPTSSPLLATLCLFTLLAALAPYAHAQTPPPVLVSEAGSTRAVALESIVRTAAPFPLTSPVPWTADTRTRITLFALNLRRAGGDADPSLLSAEAEDAAHRRYPLRVEAVAPVAGQEWLTAVVLRLSDDLGEVGDVLVRISFRGAASNRVRVAIGHAGGGLPDDAGAVPTPAPRYVVSGLVTDAVTGQPVPGAGLAATGPATATTVTDAQGRYELHLDAPGSYALTPALTGRETQPLARTLALDGPARLVAGINFTAANLFLRGRVTDNFGRGVFGVKMNISGPVNDTTYTDADGAYAYPLTAPGEFTVSPSIEQAYYTFAPGNRHLSVVSQRADFTAVFNPFVSPSHVLQFDGGPQTVDYSIPRSATDFNLFWPEGVPLGHFFWEFWAMPHERASSTYLLSDGYGGGHALLFGFAGLNTLAPGRFLLYGNIWDGGRLHNFASDDGPAPFEWGHFAVGWDGRWITTYYDGVPVGRTPFTGPRFTPGGAAGGGRLLIGGSDHSNLVGRIAQVRGFEGRNPRVEAAGGPFSSFAPQTVFSVDGQLLSYFFRPSEQIADLSLGFGGRPHTGVRRGTGRGVLFSCPECPPPQFVIDPTAPDFSNQFATGQPPTLVEQRPPAPAGALVFDSFSRPNSTYVVGGAGGLGTTEGGTAGKLNWETSGGQEKRQPFGILSGRAVLLAGERAVAWVRVSGRSGNYAAEVSRRPGSGGSGHSTGLAFRVADAANFFYAYTTEAPDGTGAQVLTVGYYEGGRRVDLFTGARLPDNWAALTAVTTRAGTIRVFADNTLLFQTTTVFLSDADGLGLYNNAAGLALANRWDNFTVYEVSP